jgi:cbb3-type cytochrome oxidase cytochrome c subunit
MMFGVVAVILIAAVVAVLLPAADTDNVRPSARACAQHPGQCTVVEPVGQDGAAFVSPADAAAAEARNSNSSFARGQRIYLTEGCAQCHTQQVRPVLADLGLGPVTQPGDFVFDDPPPLGARRVGPDLFNVGTRAPFNKCDQTVAYLKNPRSLRGWSSMPGYGQLNAGDLADLATYVTQLRPAGVAGPSSCDPNELAAAATNTVSATTTETVPPA